MLLNDIFLKEDNKGCIIMINGQEIDLSKYNILNLLDKNIDKELVKEVIDLFSKNPNPKDFAEAIKTTGIINKRITINKTVHKIPEIKPLRSINIDEERKSALGITVGETNRKDAFEIVKELGTLSAKFSKTDLYQNFDDIGVGLYFSPTNDKVEELILSDPFGGETSKGLKINHTMEKAVQLHGSPKIRSQVIAFWNNFSVFIKDELITSIKLR